MERLPEGRQGWEPAYTDPDLEPSQPLNQLRLPTDAVQAVAPRVASGRSAGPASQPATQRADVTGPGGRTIVKNADVAQLRPTGRGRRLRRLGVCWCAAAPHAGRP